MKGNVSESFSVSGMQNCFVTFIFVFSSSFSPYSLETYLTNKYTLLHLIYSAQAPQINLINFQIYKLLLSFYGSD